MATTETFVLGQLYDMPLANLQQDPNQPRKYIDPAALEEFIESITEHQVIAPKRGKFYPESSDKSFNW